MYGIEYLPPKSRLRFYANTLLLTICPTRGTGDTNYVDTVSVALLVGEVVACRLRVDHCMGWPEASSCRHGKHPSCWFRPPGRVGAV